MVEEAKKDLDLELALAESGLPEWRQGGEVFLADERNRYMGRICPWKQCEPYIRAACRAQNWGKRPFLYDDLQVIKLPTSLIAAPPLVLWPEWVADAAVPEDVVARLRLPA